MLSIVTERVPEMVPGYSQGIELHFTEVTQKEKLQDIFSGTFPYLLSNMVILATTQVETLFGELEYIEPQLKALGVGEKYAR